MNWRLVGGALVVLVLAAGLVVALSFDGGEPRSVPPTTQAMPSTDSISPW